MKAIVQRRYGSPDVLELQDVDTPVPNEDQVLVRVRAASVNPQDWHLMTGTPYIARPSFGWRTPKEPIPGTDLAGEVAVAGAKVTEVQPGDHVFALRNGAFAEYVCVRGDRVVRKPANVTFEHAAAVPVAALTALQGLRDKGQLQPGQSVLINGASGGVGTFAVQIAKALGAEVTGVCSTKNVDLVRSIGADHVIDYTQVDFTAGTERYDLILDNVGNESMARTRRALAPLGTLISNGGGHQDGKLGRTVRAMFASMVVRQQASPTVKTQNHDDLVALTALVEAGTVKPVIDRTYPLRQTAEAIDHVAAGHACGTVVITMEDRPLARVA
jgi:NADPH:quinone reductase-like Zn-dependent oxidoreductase